MIAYRTGNDLELDAVIDVYVDSTLGERHPHPARRARRREVLPAHRVRASPAGLDPARRNLTRRWLIEPERRMSR